MIIEVVPGVPFEIAGIPVMKCRKCGVTRELSSFWRPGAHNKPAASTRIICTYCR